MHFFVSPFLSKQNNALFVCDRKKPKTNEFKYTKLQIGFSKQLFTIHKHSDDFIDIKICSLLLQKSMCSIIFAILIQKC